MSGTNGVVLDAGAFIAVENRKRTAVQLLDVLVARSAPLVTSAGVVAQVWRGGVGPQVPVAFLLRRSLVLDLTQSTARAIGKMMGASRTSDAIDAHIVLIARERNWPVLTSDPDDLLAIDPTLRVERV